METTCNTLPAVTIGTPVYRRGEVGHVSRLLGAGSNPTFTLGAGRMVQTQARFEVVFSGHRSDDLPDGIIAPWLAEAARMGLPSKPPAEVEAHRESLLALEADRRRQAGADRLAAEERAAAFKLEALAKMPPDARAVIVAELHRDDSDSMTDYFNHKTERVLVLAWSTHGRDLFPELRKAARNNPATAHLADGPDSFEHRNKYSMGAGYFLKQGGTNSTGWCVKKVRFYDMDRRADFVPVGDWSLAPISAPVGQPRSCPRQPWLGGVTLTEHTHTKKGFRFWLVQLADRVERAEFDRLLTAAKARGGWYSKPWAGTPGGFAFKVEAEARAFAAEIGGPPDGGEGLESTPDEAWSAQATRERRTSAVPAPAGGTAARLRALADGMSGEIAAKFADRRSNTPKQQRQAQSARLEGYRLERTQKGLRALADLHDAGQVPADLVHVTTKAAAFALAAGEVKSSGGYYDAGHETGQPYRDTPAALAFWALAGTDPATLAAAKLRADVEGLKLVRIDGYFPTPSALVARMIEAARIPDGARVLEPSAGSGAIADALRAEVPGVKLALFEVNHRLRSILTRKGYTLAGDDFMAHAPAEPFARVLMNPPFEKGQDIEHVRHAFNHLEDGGRLVAIMSPGPFYRQDRKAAEFRAWFEALGGEREDLPSGTFKESGTDVASVLVVIDRD